MSHAVVAQQLALTRLFSATIWYYFAFLSVSLALIGLGSGAVFVHLRPAPDEGSDARAGGWAIASSVLGVAALTCYLLLYPYVGADSVAGVAALAAVTVLYGLPAFGVGVSVALLVRAMADRAGRAYAFDLGGAAVGTASGIVLLETLPPHAVLVWISVSVGLAGVVLLGGTGRWRTARLSAALVAAATLWGTSGLPRTDAWALRYARDWTLPPILHEAWNGMSRITVHPEGRGHWGQPTNGRVPPPPQRDVRIDGRAQTAISRFSGDLYEVRFLKDDLESLPFRVRGASPERALVLGSGGGNGVLLARLAGSRAVTAVEINPLIPELLAGPLASFAGAVYTAPEVRLHVEDARTFVRRDETTYDVVTLTYVDTFASSAGAYALTENYLYTVEAFEEYLERVAPGGVFGFMRTRSQVPADTIKAVVLATEALRRRGVEQPGRHMAVVGVYVAGKRGVCEVVVKLEPLTDKDIAVIREFAAPRGFDVLYVPGGPDNHPAYEAFLTAEHIEAVLDRYVVDIDVATDDSPFFFFNLGESAGQDLSVKLVPVAAGILLVVAFLLLWVLPRAAGRHTTAPGSYVVLAGCLGLGYMLFEFVSMQRFILLLGHPTYALATTLGGLLLGSGAGSLASRRLVKDASSLMPVVLVAALCVAVAGLLQEPLIDVSIHLPLAARVGSTLALLLPVGFVLGLPLPSILRLMTERGHRDGVPWAWAANGLASVLGSVAAVGLGIAVGFRVTALLAALCYLAAALAARRLDSGHA